MLSLDAVTKRFQRAHRGRAALDRVSLDLRQGEILGVLGQSGSGKSTLARLVVGLETPDAGTIDRRPPLGTPTDATDTGVQLVFQEPHDAFDPRMPLGVSLEAPLLHRPDGIAPDLAGRILRVLREVELGPEFLARYPRECSGGQLQRLTIARALLLEPRVLICDEATSALDTVTQRRILELLLRLHAEHRLSLVMISHDMNVIRYISHRVAVLFQGSLVEVAETRDFFADPQHGHSRELVAASLPVRR